MAFHIVRALWDADDGRVALLLNPDNQYARWRARYDIYLRIGGAHGNHHEFLGIFDATKPTARDWPDLPAWIILPVIRGAISSFMIELVPQRAGGTTTAIQLQFDRTVAFDYRRRGVIDEERFYCWLAESASGRAGAFERRRHLFVLGQEAEEIASGQLLQGDFVNAFMEIAQQNRHSITRMLAYAVREGRIGPAKEIHGANARREVPVKAEYEQKRFPSLDELRLLAADAGQETDSIDTKAFRSLVIDAESYEQPRLSLRLGSGERGARWLQRRITFLHIPTNQLSALRALQTRPPRGSPQEGRVDWVERILTAMKKEKEHRGHAQGQHPGVAGARDPFELLFDENNGYVRYGSDLPLLAERRGETEIYYLDHSFDGVAMGDIVGIFVASNVRLDFPSQRTESGEDAETKTAFSSLYLRFLIDRLEPMDTARVIEEYSEEIGDILNRLRSRLVKRGQGDDDDPSSGPPDTGPHNGVVGASRSGPSRGLRLAELFAPALESVLTEEDRRRARGKAGRLREVMTPADFQRLPNLAHALAVTEQFGNRVKEVGRRPPEAETGFCAAALHMVGGTERARNWLKANARAEQQAILWQMFEIEPEFVDDCARLQVVVPSDYRPDSDVLRELYALLHQPQKLERSVGLFEELGRHDYARNVRLATEALQQRQDPAATTGPSLEDLENLVRLTGHAEELLRDEIERAGAILTACKLQMEPIDPASIAVGSGIDAQVLAQLRARAAHVLQRKLGTGPREAQLAELKRIQSPGVLQLLADRLDLVDHRAEILRIVLGTVDAVTHWANLSSDQSVAPGRAYTPIGETDWDQLRQALRAPDLLPDALQIRRLAEEQARSTPASFAPMLSLCAGGLERLIAEARADASHTLGQAAGRATAEINDQFGTLERYASVALATLTARQLQVSATEIADYLTAVPATANADMQALTESWNGLGRALAPDRALQMLPDALRHAESLFNHARRLIDPASGKPRPIDLPPPPTYEEVRRALAA